MDVDEISNKVVDLEVKIASLSAQVEFKRPWYLEASTVVAVLALLFSFGTTLVSYYKAKEQEYIAARAELRSVMERLAELPLKHSEMLNKYKESPIEAAQLSGLINAENLSLSNQADAIISRIESSTAGKGKILDVELLTVAGALSSSFQHEKAKKLMEEAFKRSRDATTSAGALRSLASIALYFRDVIQARAYMQKARLIYEDERYINDAVVNKNVTNATTEIQWANMELVLSNCLDAKIHNANGKNLVQGLPPSALKKQLYEQNLDLDRRLVNCP